MKNGPIDGAVTYVIRVFFEDNVFTIFLEDKTSYIEQNEEFKIIKNLCYYKDGVLLDLSKGIERTKGYYWHSEYNIKNFGYM